MEAIVEIPLVGGAADGSAITVELDVNGRPPLTHNTISVARAGNLIQPSESPAT